MLGQLLFILIVAEIQTITGTDCHRPKRVDTQFDIGSTDGPWFVVRGLNNAYDCFNSHNITFYPAHHDVFFSVEYYDVKVNESIKRVKVESTVTQWNASSPGMPRLLECLVSWNASSPGILRFDSESGNGTELEWRVLDQGEHYMYVNYCALVSGHDSYEGSLVYSRTTSLPNETIIRLKKIATAIGYDFNDYCQPINSHCQK